MKLILCIFSCLIFVACSSSILAQNQIVDFESCVAAGNPVLRSYPPKCVAKDIGTFVQQIPQQPEIAEPLVYKKICKDLCGNGTCEEMVCLAEGCPCAESAQTCPADCQVAK